MKSGDVQPQPAKASKSSRMLLVSLAIVVAVALALPYAGFLRPVFGFVPLPATTLAALAALAVLYVATTEAVKRWFYRRMEPPSGGSGQAPR